MIKHCLKIALILLLIVDVSGCAELRRKFIRKRKPRKEEYAFYHPEEYKPAPPHERYQNHYMLWHNWHLDLERTDGTSNSRDVNSASESLKHLTAMRDLLLEEKAKELQKQIDDMEAILRRIKDKKIDVAKNAHSRRIVAKVERIIINNFSYKRMQAYIKDEGQ